MDTAPLLPSSIRDQFTREVVYLNTATCGLPPRVAHEATLAVERDRARGRLTLDIAHQAVERSRAAFARSSDWSRLLFPRVQPWSWPRRTSPR